MDNSSNDHHNILDLPDEILFIIFKKLSTVDVFYSFGNVNRRFHRLALDSLYIRHLEMTTLRNIKSEYDQIPSIHPQILSEICVKIVPRIHHQVQKLTVQQDSIEEILHAANYPQLYSLSLINFQEEILYRYLKDDLILRDLLTTQITHLNIDIIKPAEYASKTIANIFGMIISLCKKLTVLQFCDMFLTRKCLTAIVYLPLESIICSTLIKLKMKVFDLMDCLPLLDGRLESLSTLIISAQRTDDPILDISEEIKLPKLKCFSLTTFSTTFHYDDAIVPLLCQMLNLEELRLYLVIRTKDSTYIDGIQLYDQFLTHMTQLKKFTFYIKTILFKIERIQVKLPSNEDIQRSFLGRGYQPVVSYVNTEPYIWNGECHIYTFPYDFEHYFDLDNSFQGGMFHKVRQLKMWDRVSFEYKLFEIISHDFPFLEFLMIANTDPMKEKQHSSTFITFPYLTFLDIRYTHVDYAELFLLRKNTHLPRLFKLMMKYKSLTIITNNFTNNVTHFNFGTVKSLDVNQSFIYPENFHQYFPLL